MVSTRSRSRHRYNTAAASPNEHILADVPRWVPDPHPYTTTIDFDGDTEIPDTDHDTEFPVDPRLEAPDIDLNLDLPDADHDTEIPVDPELEARDLDIDFDIPDADRNHEIHGDPDPDDPDFDPEADEADLDSDAELSEYADPAEFDPDVELVGFGPAPTVIKVEESEAFTPADKKEEQNSHAVSPSATLLHNTVWDIVDGHMTELESTVQAVFAEMEVEVPSIQVVGFLSAELRVAVSVPKRIWTPLTHQKVTKMASTSLVACCWARNSRLYLEILPRVLRNVDPSHDLLSWSVTQPQRVCIENNIDRDTPHRSNPDWQLYQSLALILRWSVLLNAEDLAAAMDWLWDSRVANTDSRRVAQKTNDNSASAVHVGRGLTPAQQLLQEAFPRGWQTIPTSSEGYRCGFYAMINSMTAQHSSLGIPTIDELDRLLSHPEIRDFITTSLDSSLDTTQNFRGDQLAAVMYLWGKGRRVPLNLRLGLVIERQDPFLFPTATDDQPDVVIVWIHNNGLDDGNDNGLAVMGHYSGLRQKATLEERGIIKHCSRLSVMRSSP
ncbi:hypothetical protein C8A01DRAFT_36782 [Parachaetomium inaequale]|uniref:Uncharacterized protein n=1 Tax=Parachaetomium inaequale TaxID=2588326 RepID=A0AAN6PFM4_9PEZI|nr:hypothetical protein C8A01DRAFT_36782 [Parachaetomium inaequale]